MSLFRANGFRSPGSVFVFCIFGLWQVALFAPHGNAAGEFFERWAFWFALGLIPATLLISVVRRFGFSVFPFDYHGPVMGCIVPFVMFAEAAGLMVR
jgi:hypothetical protein